MVRLDKLVGQITNSNHVLEKKSKLLCKCAACIPFLVGGGISAAGAAAASLVDLLAVVPALLHTAGDGLPWLS